MSSRSHLIFTIHIEFTDKQNNNKTRGSLTLVDLAGSERLHDSNVVGERLN